MEEIVHKSIESIYKFAAIMPESGQGKKAFPEVKRIISGAGRNFGQLKMKVFQRFRALLVVASH